MKNGDTEITEAYLSAFHALYKARELERVAFGDERFLPVFASSEIEVFPFQVAAARFALRSPYLKGVILCDEGSLGKTYEAMLVIAQLWHEGKDRSLIVVPTPLLRQWEEVLEQRFSVPFVTVDGETSFLQEGVVLTTYDCAAERAEEMEKISWNLTVFEEAHHLRSGESRSVQALRRATAASAFKLLLTATPLQNSIMDLHSLLGFIDDTILPDEKSFYERYFCKPENYGELAERISKCCFRTTRPEVTNYVKIPQRIVMTVEYSPTPQEEELADYLHAYVNKKERIAFPQMEQYDLALMLFRAYSSSSAALAKLLRGVLPRLENAQTELEQVRRMLTLAEAIPQDSKTGELFAALKKGFAELAKRGARKKALIFTENRTTQKYFFDFLTTHGFAGKVLLYHGEKSRDYTIMKKFETEAQILLATDVAAEGFNLEFCSFVINYDLPYNTLLLEQRINRCHRQGQQSDVIVLNFLNRHNFADVRTLELINKRLLQFNGIIGLSDDLLGSFGTEVENVFEAARAKNEIDQEHRETLREFEEENKELVAAAEQTLFSSFSHELAESVRLTPEYVHDRSEELNRDLWEVTRYFFGKRPGFTIDEESRTVSCLGTPSKVFTGARMARNEYSMSPDYQPRSGRHTLTGSLARNILNEITWIGVPERGTVKVAAEVENCTIAYYRISVKSPDCFTPYHFYRFAGRTAEGRILTDEKCRALMELPVQECIATGQPVGDSNRHLATIRPHELDLQIQPGEFIEKVLHELDSAKKEEVERLKSETARNKVTLERNLDTLRSQAAEAEKMLEKDQSRLEKLQTQQKYSAILKQLKQSEQNLFLDQLRLDMELEEKSKIC